MMRLLSILWVLLLLALARQTVAEEFVIASGDVAGLAAAVEAANSNNEEDDIILNAGSYDLLFSDSYGEVFLRIASAITLKGDSEGLTVIQRPESEFPFMFFEVEESGVLTIRELTIKGGGGRNGCGGAVTVLQGGKLIVENSYLLHNSTRFSGGAVCNLGGEVTIENSVFKSNHAKNDGGAVNNIQSGEMTISESMFVENSSGRGGAIYNENSQLTITQSDFLRNTSTGSGGGIGVEHSGSPADNLLTIANSTIEGNSARIDGGGIDLHSSTASISGTTISHNVTELRGGGGIYHAFGVLNMNNTTISHNHAGTRGGGIESVGSAGDGRINLNNVTIAANSAEGEGGGIFNIANKAVGFKNTILAGNLDNQGPSDCVGSLDSRSYNLVETKPESCEFIDTNSIIGEAPLLGPLANNGGPTRTHALLSGSPAIDAGNPAQPGSGGHACEATDQRGAPRNCDIGAYEFDSVPPSAPFRINAGLNDAWYEQATDGQGFMVTVFPGARQIFLAWFTFDTQRPQDDVAATLGEPGHRWLTAHGSYARGTATMDVHLTKGGVFDKAEPEAETDEKSIGTIIVDWQNCNRATLSYEITSPGVTGKIPLERIAPDNVELCQALIGQQ